MNITINNAGGTINIFNATADNISKSKDTLLDRMYYARNKATLGGYDKWLELLDYYYMGQYADMLSHIKSCPNSSTKTICVKCLNTIMGGGMHE